MRERGDARRLVNIAGGWAHQWLETEQRLEAVVIQIGMGQNHQPQTEIVEVRAVGGSASKAWSRESEARALTAARMPATNREIQLPLVR